MLPLRKTLPGGFLRRSIKNSNVHSLSYSPEKTGSFHLGGLFCRFPDVFARGGQEPSEWQTAPTALQHIMDVCLARGRTSQRPPRRRQQKHMTTVWVSLLKYRFATCCSRWTRFLRLASVFVFRKDCVTVSIPRTTLEIQTPWDVNNKWHHQNNHVLQIRRGFRP